MTKASSDPAPTRIIAAEALRGVTPFGLSELGGATPRRMLTTRDLDNETARAAYELGRQRGFEQGARVGLQQGYSEGSQALTEYQSRKAADVARQMEQLLSSFEAELRDLQAQVATDVVTLAIDIARQVLRREPATDPNALLPAAREALRLLGEGAARVELHMHPTDADLLRESMQAFGDEARVLADADLPRGSCRIEADTGIADAGFEARWQSVMESLGRDDEPAP